MRVKLIAVLLLGITLNFVGSVYSKDKIETDKEYQIVFSEFDSSSAGKYSNLSNSIQAMLAGRLAAKERITVLEKTFSEAELKSLKKEGNQKTLSIGDRKADYLVAGTIFSLTSGLEIQVDLYPLVADQDVLHFSVLSPSPDSLIADVDKLSQEIAGTAFGVQPVIPMDKVSLADSEGVSGFVTAHPEAAYKKNVYSGAVIGVAGSGVTTRGRGAKLDITVPVDMTAMAVGDITGDGKKECLVLGGQRLMLFGITEDSIVLLREARLPVNIKFHAVNLADLDKDGKEEIYLSGTDGLEVSSMIMRFDGSAGFTTIAENIRWYLRPLLLPEKGLQLVGQKRGLERIKLTSPGIYILSVDEKSHISQGARLPLPQSVNLFDFVYADLDGDSFDEIVVIDPKEKLRVYSPGNELMWVSKKNFGGSKIYIGPGMSVVTSGFDSKNFTENEDITRELIFVPGRILIADVDQDGRQEVITSEAEKGGFSAFNRLRFYNGGAIVSLSWNGSALTESWRTGNFKGQIAGYGFDILGEFAAPEQKVKDIQPIGDKVVDKLSVGRLFVANLPKSGSLTNLVPGGAETRIAVYDLEFSKEKIVETTIKTQ